MDDSNSEFDTEWFRVPLLAILLFETAALIARSYFQVRLRDGGFETNLAADLSYLVVPPILLTLMYPVLRKHGHLIPRVFCREALRLRFVVIGIALGLVLRLGFWGGTIAMVSFGVFSDEAASSPIGPELFWRCPSIDHLVLGIFVMAVLVPLVEETFFRGFVMNRLLSRGPLFAVLVSSVLFAVSHNLQTIILAFVVGIFFALAALNSRALWVPVIAHSSYNLVAQIDWRCLRGQWVPKEVSPAMVGVGVLATGLLIVCISLTAILVSRRIIGPR